MKTLKLFAVMSGVGLLAAQSGAAQEAAAAATSAPPAIDTGDTAWMLTSTVLVLLMTLPGLALFYGGLVRAKNVLSVLMQCLVIAAVMSLVWIILGYSLATGSDEKAFFGDFSNLMLSKLTEDSVNDSIPESVWITFQMTFIIITPALIVGAFAERMKFIAVLLFTTIWAIFSYVPVWHMAWGGGLFADWGVLDFAGGTVVHINAGIAGLVACIMVGPREGYGKATMAPHSVPFTVIGAALLWVGWFGFNAGSAAAANASAGMAMITTQVATATAVLAWMFVEWLKTGKPTAVGAATGAVAGLVAITPASGSTTVFGSIVIGAASAILCYFCATTLKRMFKYDDSLDVFGVHGVGGIVGAILTGVFLRDPEINVASQVVTQAKSVLVTVAWSGIVSVVALLIVKVVVGLRVTEADETVGLDQASHGESGYSN